MTLGVAIRKVAFGVQSPQVTKSPAAFDERALTLLTIVSAVLVTINRIWLSQDVPLWLDETWTAMIATRPTWASFWREAYLDVNAPLYYLFMKLWVELAGTSNAALRLPSLIFFYAAAALPLIWRAHGLNRSATLAWSALIVLWWPGILITIDARTYALLMLASVAGFIAFMQAWRRPEAKIFLLWSAIASVQVLAHYFAFFLVAVQGLFLLWRWRLNLLRRWFAFLPLALPLAWTAYHVPRVLEYGRPGVAWYRPTTFIDGIVYTLYSFGPPNLIWIGLLVITLAGAWWKSRRIFSSADNPQLASDADRPDKAVLMAVATGVATLVFLLAFTSFKASLTERYLVPIVPAMLLGLVLLIRRISKPELGYSLVILVYAIFASVPTSFEKELKARSNYGYELASNFVEAERPDRLIFIWDHSNNKILDSNSMAEIGRFFMVRNDMHIKTEALRLTRFDDPNTAIRRAVRKGEKTAVIWLYDAGRFNSAAALFPPNLNLDPAWNCRDRRSYLRIRKKKRLWVGTIGCTTTMGIV